MQSLYEVLFLIGFAVGSPVSSVLLRRGRHKRELATLFYEREDRTQVICFQNSFEQAGDAIAALPSSGPEMQAVYVTMARKLL